MKNLQSLPIIIFCLLLSSLNFQAAHANPFDTQHLRYTDSPNDPAAAVSVSRLTERGILQGNPDGSFRYTDSLNRAEFVKIVMALSGEELPDITVQCFPDVPIDAWFAKAVCASKDLGLVRGNPLPGIPEDQWEFQPGRNVRFEEALKILSVYYYPQRSFEPEPGEQWYSPYVRFGEGWSALPEDLVVGKDLSRERMAQLTVRYDALSGGGFKDLIEAERMAAHVVQESGIESISDWPEKKEKTYSSNKVTSWGDTIQNRKQTVEEFSGPYDAFVRACQEGRPVRFLKGGVPVDCSTITPFGGEKDLAEATISTKPQFVSPGQKNIRVAALSVMNSWKDNTYGAARTYNVSAESIDIEFVSPTFGIEALRVVTPEGRLLAEKGGSIPRSLSLPIQGGFPLIVYGQRFEFFVEIDFADDVTDALVHVKRVGVTGDAPWTENNPLTTEYSTQEFPVVQIADAAIDRFWQIDAPTASFADSPLQSIAAFIVQGRSLSNGAFPHITDVTFSIGPLSFLPQDAQLRMQGSSLSAPCESTKSSITCVNIPEDVGVIANGEGTLVLMAEIPSSTNVEDLGVTIQDLGSSTSSGDVRWTDGTRIFEWVPVPGN